ncbi:hypothetical protein EWM64_g6538 [Hericium alpestre]|uniref:Uncharacterized protein n=1 Tax=Hericium alpestre TaxID=135208 RepID=A0A4Y9ZT99_9AGAM|nr:hypothetical protein EWM64_g6538 [Hericium alpestre]
MSGPEALEKIFEKLEAESERRAQAQEEEDEEARSIPGKLPDSTSLSTTKRNRRRTSISVSRFGQVDDPSKKAAFSVPSAPSYAANTSFYQAQAHSPSCDSLTSNGSVDSGHQKESEHTTQVLRIAGKQSLSRSVGGALSRTLYRSRSKASLTYSDIDHPNVVIGVIVEEKTAAASSGEQERLETARAYGPSLKDKPSRHTIAGGETDNPDAGWLLRAKGLSKKIKRRSLALLPFPGSTKTEQ